jgi:hypothetical protein
MTTDLNVELVAMVDIFEDKLEGSLRLLRDSKYIERNAGPSAPFFYKPVNELVNSIRSRAEVDPEHHCESTSAGRPPPAFSKCSPRPNLTAP